MTSKNSQTRARRVHPLAVLTVLALAFVGCQTLQYRQIQNDFQRAVEADNTKTESPFIGWYQGVAQDLTDSYIAGLPDKLRPNAWTLRAVSEWRSKQYAAANKSAEHGEAELKKLATTDKKWDASRDSVLLTMLPALTQDSQLTERFKSDGNHISVTKYETNYFPQFKATAEQLGDARGKCGPETPTSVVGYWGFETWRILLNWYVIIGGLPVGRDLADANRQAHRFLTNSVFGERFPNTPDFEGMVNAVSNTVPKGSFYSGQMTGRFDDAQRELR